MKRIVFLIGLMFGLSAAMNAQIVQPNKAKLERKPVTVKTERTSNISVDKGVRTKMKTFSVGHLRVQSTPTVSKKK